MAVEIWGSQRGSDLHGFAFLTIRKAEKPTKKMKILSNSYVFLFFSCFLDFHGCGNPRVPEGSDFHGCGNLRVPEGSDFHGRGNLKVPDRSNFHSRGNLSLQASLEAQISTAMEIRPHTPLNTPPFGYPFSLKFCSDMVLWDWMTQHVARHSFWSMYIWEHVCQSAGVCMEAACTRLCTNIFPKQALA